MRRSRPQRQGHQAARVAAETPWAVRSGFGPRSCVAHKPNLVEPFADTTVLAASEDEIISFLFPLADLHNGQDLRRAAHVRRPLGQLPLLPGGL